MPLHLLPKKSYHVGRSENLARVERDKARAEAIDEQQARLMRDYDDAVQLAALRGLDPPTEGPPKLMTQQEKEKKVREMARMDDAVGGGGAKGSGDHRSQQKGSWKRQKGEDDTERDIRIAKAALGTTPTPMGGRGDNRSGGSAIDAENDGDKPVREASSWVARERAEGVQTRDWASSSVRDSNGRLDLFSAAREEARRAGAGRGDRSNGDGRSSRGDNDQSRLSAQVLRKQELDPLANVKMINVSSPRLGEGGARKRDLEVGVRGQDGRPSTGKAWTTVDDGAGDRGRGGAGRSTHPGSSSHDHHHQSRHEQRHRHRHRHEGDRDRDRERDRGKEMGRQGGSRDKDEDLDHSSSRHRSKRQREHDGGSDAGRDASRDHHSHRRVTDDGDGTSLRHSRSHGHGHGGHHSRSKDERHSSDRSRDRPGPN